MQGSLGIDTQSSALSTPGRLNFRSALVSITERPLTGDLEGERGALGAHVRAGGRREDKRPGVHLPRRTDGGLWQPCRAALDPARRGGSWPPAEPLESQAAVSRAASGTGPQRQRGSEPATTGPFSLALAQQAAHLPRFLLDSPPPLERDAGDRGAVVAIGSCRLTTTEVTWRASGKPATCVSSASGTGCPSQRAALGGHTGAHSGPGRQQNETQFSWITLVTLSICRRDTEWTSVMSGPGIFHSHSKDRWTCFMTPCFHWQWKDTPSEILT